MPETPELTTLGQIMALPENGDFLQRFMTDHADLIQAMHTHQMNNGGKVKASFTIKVDYTLDKGLTLSMQAEATIKKPKPPRRHCRGMDHAGRHAHPAKPQTDGV